MNYFVSRGDQQYGPYTLADLQRYMAQGNILPTDLARSEGMEQWVQVQQIVGNIPVPQPPAPGPQNYGQVPVYGQMSPAAASALAPGGPLPPGLHWALVLLFAVFTCGIFSCIWMFVQAMYAKKLRPDANAPLLYGIGLGGAVIGNFIAGAAGATDAESIRALGGLMAFAGYIVIIVGHYSLKNTLEEYFNAEEPLNLQLSGIMVFFFNTIYFQYHLSWIREYKLTGVRR